MKFKVFTAEEAAKIIMDKLRQRGMAFFVDQSTVLEIVNAMYREGEWLGGNESSPYVQQEQLGERVHKEFEKGK